jgi:hypothetical protein
MRVLIAALLALVCASAAAQAVSGSGQVLDSTFSFKKHSKPIVKTAVGGTYTALFSPALPLSRANILSAVLKIQVAAFGRGTLKAEASPRGTWTKRGDTTVITFPGREGYRYCYVPIFSPGKLVGMGFWRER